jgi:hypothetical protein
MKEYSTIVACLRVLLCGRKRCIRELICTSALSIFSYLFLSSGFPTVFMWIFNCILYSYLYYCQSTVLCNADNYFHYIYIIFSLFCSFVVRSSVAIVAPHFYWKNTFCRSSLAIEATVVIFSLFGLRSFAIEAPFIIIILIFFVFCSPLRQLIIIIRFFFFCHYGNIFIIIILVDVTSSNVK